MVRRLVADDLTPVSAMARLQDEQYSFLFESVVGGERLARYSMLGVSPRERLTGTLQRVTVHKADGEREILSGTPYEAVRGYMAQFKTPELEELPRFSGGLVGYFGYDTVRMVERLPNIPDDKLKMPDIHLLRFDTVMVFDHSFNHLLLITHLDLRDGASLDMQWDHAKELDVLQSRLAQPLGPKLVDPQPTQALDMIHHTPREQFENGVRKMQEHIRAGDIFQGVPSQRLSAAIEVSPFQVYRSIRSLNPSPYMFSLRLGEASLVGVSPEIMTRVENGRVVVRPIAGTIRRGKDEAEDEQLAQQLLDDPKERAEHVMLIDLGRNDVGRVAKPGTVELVDEMVIEKYSHVQHIVSHVEGELRDDLDALDALARCHPAGTVSGAPKIRAMEIIDELEPVKRGLTLGPWGISIFVENLDTCIALRTAILKDGRRSCPGGRGVVADSRPEREYEETLEKATAMLMAIARADQF